MFAFSAQHHTCCPCFRSHTQDRSAGRDIGKMNKSGRLRKVESYHPKLAYLCDTTTQVFGKLCKSCGADGDPASCYFASKWGSPCEKDFSLRMQQRALLMECSTIVVECSFLGINGMTEAEADAEAIKRGHASWGQLREHVEESPQYVSCRRTSLMCTRVD